MVAACDEKNGRMPSPGVADMLEALDGHVEIEILHAGAVLHGIDQPQAGLDAECAEILDVGRMVRLQATARRPGIRS